MFYIIITKQKSEINYSDRSGNLSHITNSVFPLSGVESVVGHPTWSLVNSSAYCTSVLSFLRSKVQHQFCWRVCHWCMSTMSMSPQSAGREHGHPS